MSIGSVSLSEPSNAIPLPVTYRKQRLTTLSLSHTVIDSYATFLAPIVPLVIVPRFQLSEASGALLLSLGVAVASFGQPLWGYFSDRVGGRWLVILAPAICALCAGQFLLASSLSILVVMIVMNALAIGAFHPEGAATAGALGQSGSSLSTAMFIAAGPVGISLGPIIITWAAARNDYPWWVIMPGLIATVALFIALPSGAIHRHRLSARTSFRKAMKGRWVRMIMLIIVSSSRAFVAIGLSLAIPVLLKQRLDFDQALSMTGWWMSLFFGSSALGGIICSLIIRPRFERMANILSFSLAAPLLIVLPHVSSSMTLVVLAMGGVCLGSTNPIIVAMGQRIAPGTAAVASAMMLGFSWGTGGSIAPLFFEFVRSSSTTEWAMSAVGSVTIIAAIASMFIDSPSPQHGSSTR